MAKKALAFALTLLFALQLYALETAPAAGFFISVSSNKAQSMKALSENRAFKVEQEIRISDTFSLSLSGRAERAYGFLRLNSFVSPGDYYALSASVAASVRFKQTGLKLESGVSWVFPDFSNGFFVVPLFSLSLERTLPTWENLGAGIGIFTEVMAGRTFSSYRLGFYVMGRWR